jgi:hypothetical protein
MAVRLSAIRTGRVLLSRNIIFLLLGKLQGLVQLEGLGKLKKLIHLIESGTCDLSTCSIVPTLPRAPQK